MDRRAAVDSPQPRDASNGGRRCKLVMVVVVGLYVGCHAAAWLHGRRVRGLFRRSRRCSVQHRPAAAIATTTITAVDTSVNHRRHLVRRVHIMAGLAMVGMLALLLRC